MATQGTPVFDDMLVDHIRLYVGDVAGATSWLHDGYGLQVHAVSPPSGDVESAAVGRDQIHMVLTQPRVSDHPAAAYLQRHGDGVADIALRVFDATRAYDQAVRRGARPVTPPAAHGALVTATICGFGDVTHTFVQRPGGTDGRTLPELVPLEQIRRGRDTRLATVDHFAVCVEAGQMAATVEFYSRVLDFKMIFEERITVGDQAIETQAIQSRSGAVTFTLIEPDASCAPGQIDDFLKNHGGPGIQHIALSTDDIVATIGSISDAGMEFLSTPAIYYRLLTERIRVARHPVPALQRLNILVDQDHDGQLFQIFAKSVHPRNTLFLEVIERLGARTFGGGNITALYEAVELQRLKDEGPHSDGGRASRP
jgi:4-hydroxymandelate synthase